MSSASSSSTPSSSSSSRPPLKMKQPNISHFFSPKSNNKRDSDGGHGDDHAKEPKAKKLKKDAQAENDDDDEEVEVIEEVKQPENKKEVESEEGDLTSQGTGQGGEKTGDEFEVEKILDYGWCKATNRGLYRVKWLGWDKEEDLTWEPASHLQEGAGQKLKEFYYTRLAEREAAKPGKKRFLEVPPDPRTHFERRTEVANAVLPPPCLSTLEKFFAANRDRPTKAWPEDILDRCLEKVAKSKKPNEQKQEKVRQQLMLRYLKETRRAQLERLREWEAEINAIEGGSKIVVENSADLEGPPRHMKYITQYKPAPGIVIPTDPLIGCECADGCHSCSQSGCCPGASDASFPYTKYGYLRLEVGMPIFECNSRCACSKEQGNCYNRVVQKGRKVKLCIYRTDNGCGWGVKALEKIKKGTFVVEYVGEVITSEEAEERGKVYDAEGRTYLFDLDYNLGQDNPYTVDAANFGNVSHFINHSCDPNLSIFNVWIDCLDPNLPRLCMFARRDIAKGEQLNFDYCRQTLNSFDLRDYVADNRLPPESEDVDIHELSFDAGGDGGGDNKKRGEGAPKTEVDDDGGGGGPNKKRNRTECRCGADNCRKWLFEG